MSQPVDAYEAVGLRGNPFAWDLLSHDMSAPSGEGRIPVDVGPAPEPEGRLVVQVLGGRGAGKTTTLRSWAGTGAYHWVPPSGRGRWQAPPVEPVCFWDEADRLPGPVRRRALRRASKASATVVVATHADLTPCAETAGLHVRTVTFEPLTARLLERWFDQCVAAAGCAGGTSVLVRPTPADLASIAASAGTSWRVAGDLLHTWTARAVRQQATERSPGTASNLASNTTGGH